MAKDSFILYKSHYEPIKNLSIEEKGKLLEAIFLYQTENQEIELDGMAKMAFMFLKNQFDIDDAKYLSRCEAMSKNGKKGGLAKASNCKQKVAKGSKSSKSKLNDNDNDNDNVNEYDNVNADKKDLFIYWINYRKEIKKPIKVKSTIDTLIKKFNSESLDKCKFVVKASVENGWTGLFWDKYEAPKHTQSTSYGSFL